MSSNTETESSNSPTISRPLKRLILVCFGATLALVFTEFMLAMVSPNFLAAKPIPMAAGNLESFELDETLGFIPKIGADQYYGLYGCVSNEYDAEDRKGRERVLFVGDSVTHRGHLISGIRAAYGDEDFEYWNAGVESFNTAQELELYRRANKALKPDHVVLTFHNNDFQGTPVARRQNGNLELFAFYGPTSLAWLFKHSALYRLAARHLSSRNIKPSVVQARLAEFKQEVEADGATFTVILFPILAPPDDWRKHEHASRKNALEVFENLNLRTFDLLDGMLSATEANLTLEQSPGDNWHPSEEAGLHLGQALKDLDLLSFSKEN